METNAKEILKKHEEENRRQVMAKKMAEEEQKRRDINVQHWDGIQSNKVYLFSFGGGKWSNMSTVGKVFFVIGIVAVVLVAAILIFTVMKSFSAPAVRYN